MPSIIQNGYEADTEADDDQYKRKRRKLRTKSSLKKLQKNAAQLTYFHPDIVIKLFSEKPRLKNKKNPKSYNLFFKILEFNKDWWLKVPFSKMILLNSAILFLIHPPKTPILKKQVPQETKLNSKPEIRNTTVSLIHTLGYQNKPPEVSGVKRKAIDVPSPKQDAASHPSKRGCFASFVSLWSRAAENLNITQVRNFSRRM